MSNNDPLVSMETTKGTIKVRIYKDDAPVTAANFLELVGKQFYDGLIFHRYEPNFCIQGGDPTGTGTGGSGKTIPLETKPHLKHDGAGVIAMARTNDPNSATSQFYFTLAPCPFLDGQYAVFGKVEEGLEVVMNLRKDDKMTKVQLVG